MTTIRIEHVTKTFDGADTSALSNVSLRVEAGESVVVVGPSGCGKSTLLRVIAGLEPVTSGEIYFNDQRITTLPPQHRDVGMVFQNYALYPHMTVAENLAFPLKVRKVPRAEQQHRVKQVATMLGLEALLDRYPKQLSGGQQQRVAVGRALVRSPRVFLFDEPLSNLDANLRVEMRAELAALQRRLGITTLYVTHDHVEAMTMGNRIAVLRSGALVQVGTPEQLYTNPDHLFVATFLGTPAINTLAGTLARDGEGAVFIAAEAPVRLPVAGSVLRQPLARPVQPAVLAIRAEYVTIAHQTPADADGVVEAIEYAGHEHIVYVRLGQSLIALRSGAVTGVSPGQAVGVCFDRERVLLFDESGGRL